MGVGSAASNHWKKAAKMGLALLGRGFNSSKCKTMAKMVVARIKLLRNKREVVIKQMRRDIAMLLESGQDATARIRVEHVIREQNVMAANELIELFCELVVSRLSIIAKQRECPADLKEGISSLIFASPRCSDIPELLSIRDIFQKKYNKDFVSAATDLRPNAGVNRLLIEKLSVKTPSGEVKLKVLKEIAKEYQVQWDTTESEVELLKPPEEHIEGPVHFVSATSLPLKPVPKQSPVTNSLTNSREGNVTSFQDLASAAGEAAEKALAAAEAVTLLAQRGAQMSNSCESMNEDSYNASRNATGKTISGNSRASSGERSNGHQRMKNPNNSEYSHNNYSVQDEQSDMDLRNLYRRQSYNCQQTHSDIKFDDSDCDEEIEMEEPPPCFVSVPPTSKMNRRHSYNNVVPTQSDIRFDESDQDEDDYWRKPTRGIKQPPERSAPGDPVKRVHPKLPNYDIIAARFEELKHRKSRT